MQISAPDLDNIICEIIADCASVTPALDRNEIASHVIDHLGPELRKHVYAALERMKQTGTIVEIAASRNEARALRYRLPESAAASASRN